MFFTKSMDFLRMMVSKDGMSMDLAKVSTIREYQAPHDVKSIRHFLGMANFYQRFIPEFASIAKPLMDLTKKDYAFCWTAVEQGTFDQLKAVFILMLVLVYPDPCAPLWVETNALAFTIGAMLS